MNHMDTAAGMDDWIVRQERLPGTLLGDISFPDHTIRIDVDLPPAVRRSTLAHELVHARRGPLPANPVLAAREEHAVDKAAARWLINLDDLGEALAESDDLYQVAELLDVDPDTLRTRLEHLHPSEKAFLRRRLQKIAS